MTQEEKARAYDKALEIAKAWYKLDNNNLSNDDLETLFPELRDESEDERIRKALINVFATHKDYEVYFGVSVEDICAWLEKQAEVVSDKDDIEAEEEGIRKAFNRIWEEKQGEQKVSYTTIVETGNGGINALVTGEVSNNDYEEEPVDKIKPKFKVGDWIVGNINKVRFLLKSFNSGFCTLEDTEGRIYSPCVPPNEVDYHLWTIQDAKDGDVLHSTGFHNNCIFIFNGLDNWKFDEPNGDRAVATGYCCLFVSADNMEFGIQGPDCIEVNTIKPATNIQRDLLFQKVKEAGYEWDAEKKELKKSNSYCEEHCKGFQETGKCFADGDCKDKREAEQKSIWSEEDENILEDIKESVINTWGGDTQDIILDWLKFLRPQNNITDEELAQAKKDAYNDALDKIEYHSGEPTFDDGWSAAIWYLKKRNAMPQTRWKPSEEQMNALNCARWNAPFNIEILDSLYNDLKKLTE